MTGTRTRTAHRRAMALVLAAMLTMPLMAATPAQARAWDTGTPTARAMTAKQKVVLLAGAALLYYLYKKHQAKQAMTGAPARLNGQPQLYRSKNGGVYYRDPRTHQPIWLTVPRQPFQIPAADVQRYAPDYGQYRTQPVPTVPKGFRSRPFSNFDMSAAYDLGLAGPLR